MTDAFEQYAATIVPQRARKSPRVVKSEADAPMKATAAEQAQRDKGTLLAAFKRAKKAEHQAVLASAHGAAYGRMIAITKRLPDSAAELIEYLGKGWLRAMSEQQRGVVLSIISARIIHVRMIDGRPPMDDPLWDQPDNLFLICRKIVKGY